MSTFHKPAKLLRTFLSFTKDLPDRFERRRIWSPQSVMVWLMIITFPDRKTSYRNTLPILMRLAKRAFGWSREPTIASITPARKKMTISMCRSILHLMVDRCEQAFGNFKHRYGTRRFIAFDGTRIIAQRSHDTVIKLPRFKKPNGDKTHNPQALMVTAVDVFRRLPLDWIVVGKKTGERTAMNSLLDTLRLKPGDVAIMDRGLPSRKLFGLLLERGIDIVARMSTSQTRGWKEVSEFIESGKTSGNIAIQVGEQETKRTLMVRLVKRRNQKGRPRKGTKNESMLILTTLTAEDGFTHQEVLKIYAARWGIESLFKELKSFMCIEPMHTKTVAGMEQELCAALIWMSLGSLLQVEAESTLGGRKVVRTDCLRAAADLVGQLLDGESIDHDMEIYLNSLRRNAYSAQLGRHSPRECKMPFGRSIQRGG